MTLDRTSIAQQSKETRDGGFTSFWSLIFDPGIAPTLGQESSQIDLPSPCDSLWIPTYYDASLGLMQWQQPVNSSSAPSIGIPYPTAWPTGIVNNGTLKNLFGQNMVDVISAGAVIQAAPVYAIRINSANAPWLLWSLAGPSLLTSNSYSPATSDNVGKGQVDMMRSITGPISRIWYKLISYGWYIDANTAQLSYASGIDCNRLVMLASLGFNQKTVGIAAPFDGVKDGAGGDHVLNPSFYSVESGGYKITTLNTLENETLKRVGLGNAQD